MDFTIVFILALLFSVGVGVPSGWIIARYTLNEIQDGKKYLRALKLVLELSCLGFFVYYYFNRDNEVLTVAFSLLFVFSISAGSLEYERRHGTKGKP